MLATRSTIVVCALNFRHKIFWRFLTLLMLPIHVMTRRYMYRASPLRRLRFHCVVLWQYHSIIWLGTLKNLLLGHYRSLWVWKETTKTEGGGGVWICCSAENPSNPISNPLLLNIGTCASGRSAECRKLVLTALSGVRWWFRCVKDAPKCWTSDPGWTSLLLTTPLSWICLKEALSRLGVAPLEPSINKLLWVLMASVFPNNPGIRGVLDARASESPDITWFKYDSFTEWPPFS